MSDVTVVIDGKKCQAQEGESILNVARRENIFIPAICYLNQCSPTLACRLCIVDADDKRVYSCNVKVKDGMNIVTDSEDIAHERKSIMQVYDVNHPLQCGVCDKSGECELQNYNVYTGVENQQYAIKDVHRPASDWGVMKYDPGLCIVCEKCVTVCKDMIGSSALKTVKRGGDIVPKGLKTSMPKDAYAMWNKLQKSLIGHNESACIDCGECIAVCPVGALTSKDFQYTSNAWELKRVPASNPHSSDCSLIYYEVKQAGVDSNGEDKIYRVTNDPHYVSLSGAARFGYDFENRVVGKDKASFEKVVNFAKTADTIKFNSFITNEEALILQKLKEKLGVKLVNKDALNFQKFLKNYKSTSGKNIYGADLKRVKKSDFIVSVGTALRYDVPAVSYAFNNGLTMNKGAGFYFHPIKDKMIDGFSKNILQFNKLNSEEATLYLLLDIFGDKKTLPKNVVDYIKTFHSKATKTVTEMVRERVVTTVKDPRTGAEKQVTKMVPKRVTKKVEYIRNRLVEAVGGDTTTFYDDLDNFLKKKTTFTLIVGEDFYTSIKSVNLAKLVGLFDKHSNFEVLIIPSQTNTLGVSLICDLDEECGDKVLGYNEDGDCKLSALGDGDLDIPALNQQEGTFTNIDKRVVPTNVAINFNGYCLNDVANELGLNAKYTIDYTKQFPTDKGYVPLEFDLMPNFFDNGGNEMRGYLLEVGDNNQKTIERVNKISTTPRLNGTIAYRNNPITQFNYFTNKTHELQTDGGVYISNKKAIELKVTEGDKLIVAFGNEKLEVKVRIDGQIDGDIVYLPTFDKNLSFDKVFKNGSRFAKVSIKV